MVDRTPVNSSNVHSVGYDPEQKILSVEFKNGGGVYHYHDVEKDVHEGLVAARSVGGYLHANVKGIYKHSKQ